MTGYIFNRNDPLDAATVHELIGRLAPAEKIISRLIMEGHSARQIARMTGLTRATVRASMAEIKRNFAAFAPKRASKLVN